MNSQDSEGWDDDLTLSGDDVVPFEDSVELVHDSEVWRPDQAGR